MIHTLTATLIQPNDVKWFLITFGKGGFTIFTRTGMWAKPQPLHWTNQL